MPRNRTRDNDPPFDFTKRSSPIGRREKLHERMERELTNLKRDRRYWDGDPDYRAHVKRQFERVYNDPTGKPSPLRIGPPKIFTTEIEPYVEEVRRRNSGSESRLLTSKKGASQSVHHDRGDADTRDPDEPGHFGLGVGKKAQEPLKAEKSPLSSLSRFTPYNPKAKYSHEEPGALSKLTDYWDLIDIEGKTPLARARARSQKMLADFRRYGWPTAEKLFLHFLEGSGREVTLPAEFVQDYPTLPEGYGGVLENFAKWFFGALVDKKFGSAPLPLQDSQRVVIGHQNGRRGASLNDLVMWESTFTGVGGTMDPTDKHALWDEIHASIGGATLQGFAKYLSLIRTGNVIKVSGIMEFRVRDEYTFQQGNTLAYDYLEAAGLAKSFVVWTRPWFQEIEGTIILHDDRPIDVKLRVVGEPSLAGQYPPPLNGSEEAVGP